MAFVISILLAYLLMAIPYNSLVHPLVILFGLPLAFSGAVVATFLFHYTLNVFSMIGMILLLGLAIKNGILLVDRTNHNRARGMERRAALLEAGPSRLRAILMTSLTIAASATATLVARTRVQVYILDRTHFQTVIANPEAGLRIRTIMTDRQASDRLFG